MGRPRPPIGRYRGQALTGVAVVAYPGLAEGDRRWLEETRPRHDPQASRIVPHLPRAFPADVASGARRTRPAREPLDLIREFDIRGGWSNGFRSRAWLRPSRAGSRCAVAGSRCADSSATSPPSRSSYRRQAARPVDISPRGFGTAAPRARSDRMRLRGAPRALLAAPRRLLRGHAGPFVRDGAHAGHRPEDGLAGHRELADVWEIRKPGCGRDGDGIKRGERKWTKRVYNSGSDTRHCAVYLNGHVPGSGAHIGDATDQTLFVEVRVQRSREQRGGMGGCRQGEAQSEGGDASTDHGVSSGC